MTKTSIETLSLGDVCYQVKIRYIPYYTIPYHPGHCGLDLPQTTLRPIKIPQCASPAGMGRKEE